MCIGAERSPAKNGSSAGSPEKADLGRELQDRKKPAPTPQSEAVGAGNGVGFEG
jgi:hypothetical protein